MNLVRSHEAQRDENDLYSLVDHALAEHIAGKAELADQFSQLFAYIASAGRIALARVGHIDRGESDSGACRLVGSVDGTPPAVGGGPVRVSLSLLCAARELPDRFARIRLVSAQTWRAWSFRHAIDYRHSDVASSGGGIRPGFWSEADRDRCHD